MAHLLLFNQSLLGSRVQDLLSLFLDPCLRGTRSVPLKDAHILIRTTCQGRFIRIYTTYDLETNKVRYVRC